MKNITKNNSLEKKKHKNTEIRVKYFSRYSDRYNKIRTN